MCQSCLSGLSRLRPRSYVDLPHSSYERTQPGVNTTRRPPAPVAALHRYKQVQVRPSPPSSPDTPVALREGMVVGPLGPGATLRLLQNSIVFSLGVLSKLKGDESRTLLHRAVDDEPAAGHR